ncbi:MAG: hypothetical protein ACE5EK_09660, partial [Nitrospinales bacterium]
RVNQTKPLLADYFLKEADLFLKEKDYGKADRLYGFSEAVNYSNGSTHFRHAFALKEGGQLDKAIFHAQESVLIEPENPRFHLLLVRLYDSKGDIVRALFHAEKVLALWPEYEKKVLLKKQVESWEGWLQSQKEPNPSSLNQVKSSIQNGHLEDGIKELTRLMPFKYKDPNIHSLLGTLFMKKEETQKAIVAFRHSVIVQPDQPALYKILGDLAYQSGQINPAILYYQKTLKYQPSYAEISKNLQNLEGLHATTPFDRLVQDS